MFTAIPLLPAGTTTSIYAVRMPRDCNVLGGGGKPAPPQRCNVQGQSPARWRVAMRSSGRAPLFSCFFCGCRGEARRRQRARRSASRVKPSRRCGVGWARPPAGNNRSERRLMRCGRASAAQRSAPAPPVAASVDHDARYYTCCDKSASSSPAPRAVMGSSPAGPGSGCGGRR